MKTQAPQKICLFGEVLLTTRKRLNISQYKLAHLSGISERYLNFLEHGKVEPRIMTVIRIAKALGIPPGELINPLADTPMGICAAEKED